MIVAARMTGKSKTFVKNMLCRLALMGLRMKPIGSWPPWIQRIGEIKVPSGTVPRDPATTGGAEIGVVLSLLEESRDLGGDVAECGVYRASTLIPTGVWLQQQGLEKILFGFDSFEGFDESVAIDVALGGAEEVERKVGGLGQTSLPYVDAKVRRFGLSRTIRLVPGFFEKTLSTVADRKFCFVHLDVDLYESYKTCLEFFYPRVVSGGIILLDEYDDPSWPGCNKAVDEFLADRPEDCRRIERKGYVKFYIQKQAAGD